MREIFKKIGKKISNPHAYIIIFIMIIIATVMTWIIPSGQFERITDEGTNKLIVATDSFSYLNNTPVTIFEMLKSIPEGLQQSSAIIMFVFIVSGTIQVLRGTEAIDAGLYKVMKAFQRNSTAFLIIIAVAFSLMGAVFGFAEETIPFIPIGVAIALELGYDRMVGFHIIRTAAWVGFAGSFLNPFTIGIAQSIAGLPMFSGLWYRIICYFVFFAIYIIFVLKYAASVKKSLTNSVLYETDRIDCERKFEMKEIDKLTATHVCVLVIFVINIFVMIYGALQYQWGVTELSAVFLGFGIIIGIVGKLGPRSIAVEFINGMAGVTYGALIIGFARAVIIVMEKGQILDTIVYIMGKCIVGLGASTSLIAMFIIQSILNFFIGSGSGQAAATMPLMIPLADIIGVTKQSAVLAYQFGDGITNMIYPAMIYYLAFADIPYSVWVKHIFKLVMYLTIAGCVLVAIVGRINYGPF